jgi:hypothetical protein
MLRTALSRTVAALIGCLVLGGSAAAQSQAPSLEYAVKATYLYKFIPFVTWPDSAFVTETSPFLICVTGHDPFDHLLADAIAGQRVGARPVLLEHPAIVTAATKCQILYIGGSAGQSVAQALQAVAGTPVLTVTDSGLGGRAKGVIDFTVVAEHVRFDIDDAAAAANGLTLSSKLLSLAVHVITRS